MLVLIQTYDITLGTYAMPKTVSIFQASRWKDEFFCIS